VNNIKKVVGGTGHNKKIITYRPNGNSLELDLPLLPEIVTDDVETLVFVCDRHVTLKV
jgi:hypothetical protein